jgi:hypothetical protein
VWSTVSVLCAIPPARICQNGHVPPFKLGVEQWGKMPSLSRFPPPATSAYPALHVDILSTDAVDIGIRSAGFTRVLAIRPRPRAIWLAGHNTQYQTIADALAQHCLHAR